MANTKNRVGPVNALAITTTGISRDERLEYVGSRPYGRWDTVVRLGDRCEAHLIAVAAGSITLEQVVPQTTITLGQLQEAQYSGHGDVRFVPRHDPELRELMHVMMEYSGLIVVARGFLARQATERSIDSAQFAFEPTAWDTADLPYHTPDRQFDPACGLVHDPALLRSLLPTADQVA